MNHVPVSPLLRLALRLDAIATLATGAALAMFASPLATLLGLPDALLAGAGAFCVAYAVVVGWMGSRARLPRWSVWAVVIGNAIWATECLVIAFGDAFAPTVPGVAFLVVQAAGVYGFAALQLAGLRAGARAYCNANATEAA